jgi:hypothetical protein
MTSIQYFSAKIAENLLNMLKNAAPVTLASYTQQKEFFFGPILIGKSSSHMF